MERHLHYKDKKSDKFWKIAVSGKTHTVSYGRTGTTGQSKKKSFDDNSAAQKDAEKLINSKIKKGYVDIGEAPTVPANTKAAPNAASNTKPAKLEPKKVVDYVHGKPFDVNKMAPKIVANPHDEGDKTWDEKFSEYLLVQDASATTHFVAGIACEAYEMSNTNVVLESLVKHKAALPNLVSLFLNDIDSEECELSWLIEGDLTPVWEHFPNLREFTIRGYPGEMGVISMPHLERFTVECSGMTKKNLEQIFAANMPNLTHLELWLGTDDYGGQTKAADLEPLLSGHLFPKLKYLGLRNCDYADDLAQSVIKAPILDRVETLDMSYGTMGDDGGVALYQSDKVRKLKHLNLEHHFMSDWMVGRFIGVDKAPPKPLAAPVTVPVSAPVQRQYTSPPQPAKSGGFLSKLFGKKDPVIAPVTPVETIIVPAQASASSIETASPKSRVNYAEIPLIPAGSFGPTVNVDGQEPSDEDGWRYVAFGE